MRPSLASLASLGALAIAGCAASSPDAPPALSPDKVSGLTGESLTACLARAERGPPEAPQVGREVLPLPARGEWLRAAMPQLIGLAQSDEVESLEVNEASGTVTVTGTPQARARVVIALGGCVDASEDFWAGRSSLAVLVLEREQASALALRAHSSAELLVLADRPTNSLVFKGSPDAVRRAWKELARLDCLAPLPSP